MAKADNKRQSVAILGMGANAPELYECGNGIYELEARGNTYRFKASDINDALNKVYSGEYKQPTVSAPTRRK